MRLRSTWLGLLAMVVAARIGAGLVAEAAGEPVAPDAAIDCGPAARFALAAVEGRGIDYDRLAARLPQRRGGHSMKELRDAARSFGMDLEGSFVGKHADTIDRPMLVFIQDRGAKVEHFLVVRPVGHTGSLVQLIDSNGPPRVIEKSELVSSSQWTGIVLAPVRSNWGFVGGLALLSMSGLMGLGLWVTRRRGGMPILAPGGRSAAPAG